MRIARNVKPHEKLLACMCGALILVLAACQTNTGAGSNNSTLQIPSQKQNGSPPANSSPIALQISPHDGHPATPTTGTFNPGASPGPVPTGNGQIPAAFPRYFSFGVMSSPATAAALDEMRRKNGAAFTFRYQYLTGGANTGRGWETWQQPAGQFATSYMQESDQYGYIPTFVFYEICLTNGPYPSDYCGGHNVVQDTGNLASASAMKAYFGNWVLMLQKIRAFGKPVLVIVEPDLWGFLQNAAGGTANAASVPASVAASGFADAAGFPNNAQGFAWALLHMRDKYAPNAILTLHASTWASGSDIATSTDAGLNVAGMARLEATFLNSAGLVGNPAGVSSWDLISSDVADFDSAQPNGRSWWDRYNRTFPNFARYLTFIGDISQQTRRRIVMWQVPMGNQYFDTMNNTPGHYQDNRAEYILGNVSSFATAGVIAVLFGPGNGGTMNIDAMRDGVTNPTPIISYECNACNTRASSYPDDDGGFLRIFVGMYVQHPVAIS
jgi:hypothetical protein